MKHKKKTGTKTTKHSYSVQVGRWDYVTFEANTRTEAAKLAKAEGLHVWSVNMIG